MSIAALYGAYSSFPFADTDRVFDIPVLAVHGEQDLVSPISAARDYLATITAPSTALVGIPGAGHLVEFAAPDRLLHAIIDFIGAPSAPEVPADSSSSFTPNS
jgi:pimeloyl-ACP methyl ester carboxylesterase